MRQTSNARQRLKALGVKKGDVVTIYMPMVPELVIAILACARIGAAHSVIFGGFAPTAISERVIDAHSKRHHHRRRRLPPWRSRPPPGKNVEEAVRPPGQDGHIINHVLCSSAPGTRPPSQRFITGDKHRIGRQVRTTGGTMSWPPPPRPAPASHGQRGHALPPLHLRLHRQAQGHRAYHRRLSGLCPGHGASRSTSSPMMARLFWCSADIGWITGHSYVLYGP
jgi:acetyl-CoA synthetase